ncbi:MAG TPA: LysR substrate-binding domain-containing protein [Myxococcaceae bacterium]|nr:LysR substrate-binding domain-containing protein [Myxococcaceae bacterium]
MAAIACGAPAPGTLTEGFDAAIRVNAPDTNDLVKRRFATCCMQLVAAPGFVAKFGKLTPSTCRELPMALFDHPPVAPPWRFSDGKRRVEVTPCATPRLSTLAMVHDAVLEGAGVGSPRARSSTSATWTASTSTCRSRPVTGGPVRPPLHRRRISLDLL